MLAVGRVTKLFGVDGGLLINLYDVFPADFNFEEQPLFAKVDNLVVPLYFDHFERHGASGAFVRFADLDSTLRVNMIMGHELYVEEDESADDGFDPAELIGYRASVDGRIGVVSDFYDNDVNPLFEIELDGKRHLVPAVEEFIAGFNKRSRTIVMQLPEGLLDL